MNRHKNFRVYFLLAALGIAGLVVLLREHRPSFLRPDLHLSAYVTTADGNVTVVDLVKLKAVARIAVGPGLSGMREHPTRAEIYGVSSAGGYVWILDPRANHFTGQVTARIGIFRRTATASTRRRRGTTRWSRLTLNRAPSLRARRPGANPYSPTSPRTASPSWS